jgi:hypothetical protein
MKVLIACEESQTVCKAFRARGHETYSCDIVPCRGGHPEWHIQDDVLKHLTENWDLMIAHPPCTYLANSGVCHLYNKDRTKNQDRWEELQYASLFFERLFNAPIPKICIENPIPHKYGNLPKYTQIIHPWQFGHTEQKPTCLWLKNLPPLIGTKNVFAEMKMLPPNKRQRIHYLPPSPDRQRIRSVTYQGIADAMADQWGSLT